MLVKKLSIPAGITFLLIGLLFIACDFIAPHTVLTQESVQIVCQTSDEVTLSSIKYTVLEDNGFVNFAPIQIVEGQAIKIDWQSGLDGLSAFVFTVDQFNAFKSNVPQGGYDYAGNYEAYGVGGRGNNGAYLLFLMFQKLVIMFLYYILLDVL